MSSKQVSAKGKEKPFSHGPIPFLQPDDKGQFSVYPAAVKVLEAIRTPVAVVCVAGPYRTGKSYLLNRLIHNENIPEQQQQNNAGFNVGNTVNACTKGIWLWSEPYYNEANKTTYIFLDTEGLNSTGEEVTFDTQIFSLSVLLSSIFILNTQNSITESALEQLELVAECSKKISFQHDDPSGAPKLTQWGNKTDDDEDDEEEEEEKKKDIDVDRQLALHFPRLIWVLRDFALQLQDKEGAPITPNQYLERTLQPIPGTKRGTEDKNRIRKCIRDCFIKRDCVPMPRPVNDENLLHKLQTLPASQLRPEFQAAVKHMKLQLLQLSGHFATTTTTTTNNNKKNNQQNYDVKKYINNKPVTGDVLLGLATAYCTAINNGEVPTILSAWQSVVETKKLTELHLAKQRMEQFLWKFAKADDLTQREYDVDVVKKHFEKELNRVAHMLHTAAFPGDAESANAVLEQLRIDVAPVYENVLDSIELLATEFNQKVFQKILNSVEQTSKLTYKQILTELSLGTDLNTIPDLSQHRPQSNGQKLLMLLNDILTLYSASARGNKNTARYLANEKDVINELMTMVVKDQAAGMCSLEQHVVEWYTKHLATTQALTKAQAVAEKAQAEVVALKEKVHESKLQHQLLQQEITGLKANVTAGQAKCEKLTAKLSTAQDHLTAAQARVTELTQNHHEMTLKHNTLLDDLKLAHKAEQQLQQQQDKTREELAQVQKDLKDARNTNQQHTTTLTTAKREMKELEAALAQANAKTEKTQRELEEKTTAVRTAERSLAQAQERLTHLQNDATKSNDVVKRQIAEYDQKMGQLQQQLAQAQADLVAAERKHTTQYNKLQQQHELLTTQHAALAAAGTNNQQQQQQQVVKLQQALREAQTAATQAEATAQAEREELLKKHHAELEALKEQHEHELVEVEDDINAQWLKVEQDYLVDIENMEKEIDELEKELEEKISALASTSATIASTINTKQVNNHKSSRKSTLPAAVVDDDNNMDMGDDDMFDEPPQYEQDDYQQEEQEEEQNNNNNKKTTKTTPTKRKTPTNDFDTTQPPATNATATNPRKKQRFSFASVDAKQVEQFYQDDDEEAEEEEEEEEEQQQDDKKKRVARKSVTPQKKTTSGWSRPFTLGSPLKAPDQRKIIERRRRNGSVVPDYESDKGSDDDENENDSDDEMIQKPASKKTQTAAPAAVVTKKVKAKPAPRVVETESEQEEEEEEEVKPVVAAKKGKKAAAPSPAAVAAVKGKKPAVVQSDSEDDDDDVVVKKKPTSKKATTTTTADTATAKKTVKSATHERSISDAFKSAAKASWQEDGEEEYQRLKKEAAKKANTTTTTKATKSTKKALPPDAEPVRDPKSCSVGELKGWLTSIDITFPPKAKKDELIALLRANDPRL